MAESWNRVATLVVALVALTMAGCQTTGDTYTEERSVTPQEAMLRVPLDAKDLDIYDVEIVQARQPNFGSVYERWDWREGTFVVEMAGPGAYFRTHIADVGDFRHHFAEHFGGAIRLTGAVAVRQNPIGDYFAAEARLVDGGAPCLAVGQALAPENRPNYRRVTVGSSGILMGVACLFDGSTRVADVERIYLPIFDRIDVVRR